MGFEQSREQISLVLSGLGSTLCSQGATCRTPHWQGHLFGALEVWLAEEGEEI